MYKILVYQILYKQIQQKNRVIQKKYFLKIKEIDKIPLDQLTPKLIEVNMMYQDFSFCVNFIKEGDQDWYIEKQNKKSEKFFF